MPKLARHCVIALATIAALSGCSSSQTLPTPTDQEISPAEVASPLPTPTPEATTYLYRIHWDTINGAGYTASNVVEFGEVATGATDSALLNGCDYDIATDGYIPARITRTNTTSGFSYTTNFNLRMETERGSAPIVPAFAMSSRCAEDPAIILASNTLGSGQSASWEFAILLRNYISPQYPDGHVAGLGLIRIYGTNSQMQGDVQQTTSSTSAYLNGEPR